MEEQIKMPVEALDDSMLEEVSGGFNIPEGISTGLSGYNTFSSLAGAVLAPFADEIESAANKIRYKKVLPVLATYDTSLLEDDVLAANFADSWNANHPNGGTMTAGIAACIIALKDYPYARAEIACMRNVKNIVKTLNKLYSD